ncbi:MAG TPA: pteridine reductase [Coxiellaceae bacterium]|nr:pteridine reductase [Coxiellaceae bacterium]
MMESNSNAPVALITGAARRIGAAIATALHAQAYRVIIHYYHSEAEALALTEKLNAIRPDSAIALKASLDDIKQITHLAEKACAHWQRLDLLVNNASRYFSSKVGETSAEDWHKLMNSNLMAPYFLVQKTAKALKATQGNIINIIDIHAQTPLKNYTVYSTAKAGLAMLTKALAKELGPDIRVNGVAPGPTLWPEGENALDETLQTHLIAKTALKRKSEAEDIAKTVLFLAEQKFLTGQIINVDGGRVLNI